MHGIKELDAVMVPAGENYRTWHNLEKVSPSGLITPREAEEVGLFPTIREAEIIATVKDKSEDDETETHHRHVEMPSHKGLVAETREGQLVPIHVASNQYAIIQNRKIAELMSSALQEAGIEYKFSAMGTLKNLSHFFVSIELGENGGMFKVNGEDHLFHLNALTNHCGMSFRTHGSHTRVVCANTFDASRYGDKKLMDFKVVHKGNVEFKCRDLAQKITGLLKSRESYVEEMEMLAAQKVAEQDIQNIVAGYYIQQAFSKVDKFSTRTLNAVSGITDLSIRGRGNRGESLYDVFNGGTEYWTSGDGVGRRTSDTNKAFSSEFGTAAAHKRRFGDYLIDNADSVDQLAEEGRVVMEETLKG